MTDPKELRRRLDGLNRAPLPVRQPSASEVEDIRRRLRKLRDEAPPPPPLPPVLYRRDLPQAADARSPARATPSAFVALSDAIPGTEVRVRDGGTAYLIARRLADADASWAELSSSFADALRPGGPATELLGSALGEAGAVRPEDVVFLDLETTGLAGTPLFLIGTMGWEDGSLVVRQYFARDYAEERSVILLFGDCLGSRRLLITFNGKSFDLPYVRLRATANRLRLPAEPPHLDLLHESRRAWRRRVPDCRLQTLESFICGRVRRSDIPSQEIPDAYHAFVRSGNAVEMAEVVRHNMLDLATLAELMLKLGGAG